MKTKRIINSEDIGAMKGKYESYFDTSSDASHSARRSFSGYGVVYIEGTEHPSSRVTIKDVSPCESDVTVNASGQYPISWASWTGIPPIVDYEMTFVFKRATTEQKGGSVEVKEWHNPFPDYEAELMQT